MTRRIRSDQIIRS